PCPSLFPYTTLFRSQAEVVIDRVQDEMEAGVGTDARAGDAVRPRRHGQEAAVVGGRELEPHGVAERDRVQVWACQLLRVVEGKCALAGIAEGLEIGRAHV